MRELSNQADARISEKTCNQPKINESACVGGPGVRSLKLLLKRQLSFIFLLTLNAVRLDRHVKELSVGLPTEDLGQIVFTDDILCFSSFC